MYTLNGKHPDLSVIQQYLDNGDEIVFHYTDNYPMIKLLTGMCAHLQAA